ncbi:NUDIX hydrolase [Xylanimonas cellulosilytica DSM 15894]|uniref:NUDIX hydrolase n=1 Tax=Xylanimonas cellulosilytica (strain DSM 15894 / JCM 12276 / CECT 5975 / KCTC 9989 / LMG 20990 / NBRC 107835 / XIL07) TaxID=446471 RepID=D1BZT7_XYLCX|nr:NUDIX domain-containing protein [Xylanimonas cellulosilytica]ACZ32065.1 NUDIX hydrolase [Xylanimonas cellulosilytica DSM 15894]
MPIPPYVAELRSLVGHRQLWLPGVTVVVRDDDGRLLLAQRADTGRWALVSGIVDPGEEPAVAATREVAEETCVDVVVQALAAVSTTPELVYPNGDRSVYLDLLFTARPASVRAVAAAAVGDDENLAVGWFVPDALPADLMDSTRFRLGLLERFEAGGSGAAVFSA